MLTKPQMIEEILSLKPVDTKSNLMKKSAAELQTILTDLEAELVAPEQPVTQVPSTPQPQFDMQAMMEQMKREMMAELKEQARKEVEAEMNVNVETSEPKTVVPTTTARRADVDRFELIPVMNITNGHLIYGSRKTGAEWNWTEYGDIETMEFQEILSMRSAHRRFVDEPFILIMHDDAVEQLGLTKMYESMPNPSQIDEVFKLDQEAFENVVDKSPKGIKILIISRARQLYETGVLDSARKIKFLNERYQSDIGLRG